MRAKKRDGFVIEMMIGFMLVTFAFCVLVTTSVTSLSSKKKIAKTEMDIQTTLNQIGEYYLRSVEAGKTFPTGTETNYNKTTTKDYSWMDDNGDNVCNSNDKTVQFFLNHKDFRFTDKISATFGGVLDFYQTKSVYRRLTVTLNGQKKMVLTVKEIYVDKNTSKCEIVTWYTGDDVIVTDDSEFEGTSLNLLQKLWRFFGKLNGDVSDANLFAGNFLQDFADIFTLLGMTANEFVNTVILGSVT